MKEKTDSFLTTSQFARRAGVTVRALRFYDKKGLLKPSSRSEAGYRLYTGRDLAKLQNILTLKFIGFSIDDIKNIIESGSRFQSIKETLNMQKKIIQDRIEHMTTVAGAIAEAEEIAEDSEEVDFEKVINVIRIVNSKKYWMEQYKNSINLTARISLHDRFSTNSYGWHRWLFDRLGLKGGMKVLDLGCGEAALWVKNADRIPEGCTIDLTDISSGMLKDAKTNLGENANNFTFEVVDAQTLKYDNSSFDMVLANHMLYHISNRDRVFSEVCRVLKPGGHFFAATNGVQSYKEMKEMLFNFDPSISLQRIDFFKEFGLENGREQLLKWFAPVNRYDYEDSLVVTEVEPLINYIMSTTGNIQEVLTKDRLPAFRKILEKKLKQEGSIYITKSSGVFKAIKEK